MYTAFAVVAASSARAQAGAQKSITDIPLKAHTRDVDIFFNDEKPKEPYYRVMIVEQRLAPDASMDALLLAMKKTAQAQGIDGVLLGRVGEQAGNVISYPSGDGFVSYQRLAGIGIRYRRTVDYIDTILKEQSVSLWIDSNANPKLFTMKYDFYGNNLSLDDRFIYKFFDEQVFPFEDGTSCYASFGEWESKYNAEVHVFTRKRSAGLYSTSTSRFYYEEGKLAKAEIVVAPEGSQKRDKWQLQPLYSSNGLPIGRRLMDGKNVVWEETIAYRLIGMPDKVQRFTIAGGQRIPLFEIKNTYYSDNDLPAPEH